MLVPPSARASRSLVIPVDLSACLERPYTHFCFPRGIISDVADPSSATDNDSSGVSFRPNFDVTDNSDSREALNSTELTTPEPTYLPDDRSGSLTRPKRPVRRLADASVLPDFSDNPNNDIDEDLIDIPLDYGRLD